MAAVVDDTGVTRWLTAWNSASIPLRALRRTIVSVSEDFAQHFNTATAKLIGHEPRKKHRDAVASEPPWNACTNAGSAGYCRGLWLRLGNTTSLALAR